MSVEIPMPGEPDPAELAAAAAAPRRPSLWRHRDFMKLWSAQTISLLGDEMTGLAVPLIAILILHASAFEMGVLGTLLFLPFILLTLPAGAWVDRLRRRPILISADLGRAAILLSIPIAYVLGALTLLQLYIAAFLVGCLQVFFDVAYQSYLPVVVEREQLVEGNAKLEISRSAAALPGPGVAGLLISVVSAPFAIIVDAISFLGSATLLFLIRRPESKPERVVDAVTGKHDSMRTEITEGLRYVLGHPYLRNIAACTGTLNLFGNIAGVILLLYAVRELHMTPAVIGIIFAIGNVGTLIAAVSTERITRWLRLGPTIVISALLSGPAAVLVAIAPRDNPFPFLLLSFILVSLTNVTYNVNQVSLRQAITPERMQGRMNATMRFIVWGTIPVGSIIGGFLGDRIGLQPTLWVGAIGSFLGFLPVLFSPVRALQRIPEPEAAAA
jgi:MFS family permease